MNLIEYLEQNKEKLYDEFMAMTGKYEEEELFEPFDWNDLTRFLDFLNDVLYFEYGINIFDYKLEIEKILVEKYGYIRKEFPMMTDAETFYLAELFDRVRRERYE